MSATIATEDILVIETPERVPLHFALASIGNRFLACAIDHAMQAATIALMAIALTVVADYSTIGDKLSNAPKWVYAVLIVTVFLIVSGYFAFFEWLWSGQTPGKRWLKLRVIREDGRPITFFEAAVRNLLRSFDMMPAPFYSIGLISVFSSTRDQRVGDMVAGTVRGNIPASSLGSCGRPASMDGLESFTTNHVQDSSHIRPCYLHLRGVPGRATAPVSPGASI